MIRNARLAEPASVAGDDEDVHSFVERRLVERLGDAGRRLHTGRSRNEQVSLDLRLYLRRRTPRLQQALVQVIDALADEAGEITGQLDKKLREETNALRTVVSGLQNQVNELRDELREARLVPQLDFKGRRARPAAT